MVPCFYYAIITNRPDIIRSTTNNYRIFTMRSRSMPLSKVMKMNIKIRNTLK